MAITIRDLAEQSGVKVPTIRHYERQGLLPEPVRTGTGQRRYGSVDVARLRFVRFSRGLGLEIGEIRALIEMVGEGNGEEIVVLAETVAERAERMRVFYDALQSVSVAIIGGTIDEVGAFACLAADERPGPPEQEKGRLANEAAETEEPGEHVETLTNFIIAGEAVTCVDKRALDGIPVTEKFMEGDAAARLLSKPKRKRNPARS